MVDSSGPQPEKRKRTRKGRSASGPDTEQVKQREQRIEEARQLMALNYSDGDLKRMLSQKWSTSPRTVSKYLSRARARQRNLLGRTEQDARADSLDFWRRKQQEAQQRAFRAEKDMVAAQEAIKKAEATLDDIDARDEAKEIAAIRLKAAVTRQDHARRMIWSSNQQVREDQQVIDKLLGNHAPLKIAKTDKAGNDVPLSPSEPVNPDKSLEDLLASVEGRMSPSVN